MANVAKEDSLKRLDAALNSLQQAEKNLKEVAERNQPPRETVPSKIEPAKSMPKSGVVVR